MAITLALLSALFYGVTDFVGGVLSRRAGVWQVATVGQASSAVCTLAVALVVTGDPTGAHLVAGALGGLGAGFGTAFLYRGFSRGRMGVVAPISAAGSALVPVATGLAQGDRPSALAVAGVVLAFPAIWWVARIDDDTAGSGGVVDGILAGLGFGALFALLGQVPEDAGMLPLGLAQVFSVVGVVAVAIALREPWVPRDRAVGRALVLGPLGTAATVAFLLSTHHGLLTIVSVIAALYPASTVLLALLVLHERIGRVQAAGLALAATAVTLVALG